MKLLSIPHCGEAGHRVAEATSDTLSNVFTWKGCVTDAHEFTKSCLLCIISKTGNKIPRPFSLTLHAIRPNQVSHFDYLYLGDSMEDDQYALVVKDHLGGYVWIEPTKNADAESASKILAKWTRTFSAPETWVSDQERHFKN